MQLAFNQPHKFVIHQAQFTWLFLAVNYHDYIASMTDEWVEWREGKVEVFE
jgi:hypothetical protein